MICEIYNYYPNYNYEKIILTNINVPQFVFEKHIFANICSNFFKQYLPFCLPNLFVRKIYVFRILFCKIVFFYKVSRKNQFTNLYFAKFLKVHYQRIVFHKSLTSFESNFVKKNWKTFGWKKPTKYESIYTIFSVQSNLQIGIL